MSLRCHFNADGWLVGPINITHRMTPNRYNSGFAARALGLVFHTEDGFEQGTIATFMNPNAEASAWFSVGQDGHVTQYLPVGRGYVAWAEMHGNPTHYSIEDEDQRNPAVPLTDRQMTAFAQVFEACAERDGFPLARTSDPVNGRGLILHSEGGAAWGGHTSCPGTVRGAQAGELIRRAIEIRAGGGPAPAPDPTQEEDVPTYPGQIRAASKAGVPVVLGTTNRLALFADFTTVKAPLSVRVAVYSAAKGFSQIVTVELADSKPHYVTFAEKDVAAVSFERTDTDTTRDVGFFITGG